MNARDVSRPLENMKNFFAFTHLWDGSESIFQISSDRTVRFTSYKSQVKIKNKK